jgi:acyl-CoA synthetase (AMP-forming)/AMP-acid ligase II
MERLRPTFESPRARHWRRRGGPWDTGDLNALSPTGDQGDGGGHLSLVDGEVRLGARQLGALVDELAGRMLQAGTRRGDVVAWQLPNCASASLLFWACWRIGAIAAPLHRRLGTAEVVGALGQIEPRIVLAAEGLAVAEIDGAMVLSGDLGPGRLLSALTALPPRSPSPALRSSSQSRRSSSSRLTEAPGQRPSDIAAVLFTSGSSGVPKAVLHTHRGLAYKARLMARVHGLSEGDAVLAPAPLGHVSGLLNGVLISAALHSACVLIDPWDPERALQLIEQERIAFMGAPPIFFSQMAGLAAFSRERVQTLRLISTGGASVSPAFVDVTADSYGCRVKRTYGSTEAPTVTTSGPSDPLERARDTDGHPVGEAEVEIHDPVDSSRLPPERVGEIWIRGPELFVGYADRVSTASVIAEPGGWYRSGDLGSLDAEGWLRVTGRLSDTIIRAGENISASEVEAVLESHPAVRNAVAVPVPDAKVGERVAAFVVASGSFGLDECREWFAERGITRFKTPELVIPLEEIPTLAAGKPDRAALKAAATEHASRMNVGPTGVPRT